MIAMGLNQYLALIVLFSLIISSIIDLKKREVYVLPWIVFIIFASLRLVYTFYIDITRNFISSYLIPLYLGSSVVNISIIVVASIVTTIIMFLEHKQSGDLYVATAISLTVPFSPFLLSPLVLTSVTVLVNSTLLLLPFNYLKKTRGKSLPFIPFLTVAFVLSVLGL